MMQLNDTNKTKAETAQPMWKIVLSQFLEHRLAVLGVFIILFFVGLAVGADLISSYTGLNPNKQNVASRYLLPFTEDESPNDFKEDQITKFIAAHPVNAKAIGELLISGKKVKGQFADKPEEALFELATSNPAPQSIEILQSLSSEKTSELIKTVKGFRTYHVFGTDEVGRDVLIRLIYGARVSLGVGVMVAFASALIGLFIGSIAGFYGGAVDTILMRVTDSLISLPTIPVLIVLAAVDIKKVPILNGLIPTESESIFKLFVVLCVFSWMTVARLVRGSILSLREREFVLAAKTLGAKDSTIILRHMFPNVLAPMVVSITLGVGQSILFEAALSFLGLGIMPPTPSWGNMLNNAQEVMYKNIWLALLPGIMILLTTISFNFVGDGLQDAVDPKAIRR